MKKKIYIAIGVKILLFILAISYSYFLKGLRVTYLEGEPSAHINDFKFFETSLIKKSNNPSELLPHPLKNKFILSQKLNKQNKDLKTAGFIVLKDDKILHESYQNGYTKNSKTNSFSMAKTLTTLLLDLAIQDGYIKNVNQPITDFIPEFLDDELAKDVTVGDFSSMTSGYDWVEDYYNPFTPTTKAYFGSDIEEFIVSRGFSKKRDKKFQYSSGDIQVLGISIRRATKKSLSEYASQKLWEPLGISQDAMWGVDGDDTKVERSFCCIYANSMTWAKIGQLILNDGKWDDKQIIRKSFVELMRKPVNDPNYGYGSWLQYDYKPSFYSLVGHRGQRTIIIPEHNLVIVRLGEDQGKKNVYEKYDKTWPLSEDLYIIVDEVVKSLEALDVSNI